MYICCGVWFLIFEYALIHIVTGVVELVAFEARSSGDVANTDDKLIESRYGYRYWVLLT